MTAGRWALFHHVDSRRLGDESAPLLPDDVPSQRTPFVLDFVYPVKDLDRAIAFYTQFLGEPEWVTADRASFRLLDSRFELEAEPFDERITILEGAGNGFYVAPTIIDRLRPDSPCAQDEIFGPVLSILRVDTLDEAIALENGLARSLRL